VFTYSATLTILGFKDQIENIEGVLGQDFRGTQQDGLFIQSLTIVRNEDGRNIKNGCTMRPFLKEHGAIKLKICKNKLVKAERRV
jgi:hypothetical protein